MSALHEHIEGTRDRYGNKLREPCWRCRAYRDEGKVDPCAIGVRLAALSAAFADVQAGRSLFEMRKPAGKEKDE